MLTPIKSANTTQSGFKLPLEQKRKIKAQEEVIVWFEDSDESELIKHISEVRSKLLKQAEKIKNKQ